MILIDYIFYTILLLLFFYIVIVIYLSLDRIGKYDDVFKLKKAALVYSSNYRKLGDIIIPTRKSPFGIGEPTVWVYRNNDTELFMSSNHKKDVRIWSQINGNLHDIHFVLDSKKNNRSVVSNLMYHKLPSKKLELEGDFNDYFNLYYDDDQQIQTLQILAPNLMAYLIDGASLVDVEVLNNQIAILHTNAAKTKESLQAAIELTTKLNSITEAASKVR